MYVLLENLYEGNYQLDLWGFFRVAQSPYCSIHYIGQRIDLNFLVDYMLNQMYRDKDLVLANGKYYILKIIPTSYDNIRRLCFKHTLIETFFCLEYYTTIVNCMLIYMI